jgi:hypothetical protein
VPLKQNSYLVSEDEKTWRRVSGFEMIKLLNDLSHDCWVDVSPNPVTGKTWHVTLQAMRTLIKQGAT